MERKLVARKHVAYVATTAMVANLLTPAAAFAAASGTTLTPIKHVIIIIGENRTFDHIFATYAPKNTGETVLNLLSQGIVKADGSPGPNYGDALQYKAFDTKKYHLTPPKTPYVVLPPALSGGGSNGSPSVCVGIDKSFTGTECVNPANLVIARKLENGLADGYHQYLLTGGTGQPGGQPDTRIFYDGQGGSHLPPGPYQLTQDTSQPTYPYDAYAASPVHRFYQMYQQLDCDAAASTERNGWGCLSYPICSLGWK
jgi:phospholipase C